MTLLFSVFFCAVALGAGGYALPGLAYGKTTVDLTRRIGSQFERLGRALGRVGASNAKLPVHLPMEMTYPDAETEITSIGSKLPVDGELPVELQFPEVPELPATTGEDIRKILRDIPEGGTPPFESFDPEYEAILYEIDLRNGRYKFTHRDLQWKICAELLRDVESNEDRVELVTLVRRFPFHRRLPATIAITPTGHRLWTEGRRIFLERVRAQGGLDGVEE